MHYDDDGNLLTSSFVDYLCLGAADVPPLRIGHRCTPSPFTLLGAKGLGEGNTMSVPAALAAAVADALEVETVALPLTPGADLGAGAVKPAAFEYRRAESLDDALELLEEGGAGREAARRRPEPGAAPEHAARCGPRCSST